MLPLAIYLALVLHSIYVAFFPFLDSINIILHPVDISSQKKKYAGSAQPNPIKRHTIMFIFNCKIKFRFRNEINFWNQFSPALHILSLFRVQSVHHEPHSHFPACEKFRKSLLISATIDWSTHRQTKAFSHTHFTPDERVRYPDVGGSRNATQVKFYPTHYLHLAFLHAVPPAPGKFKS